MGENSQIALRPAGRDDEDFLYRLFLSTRGQELAFLPEAQREPLMRMQFRGQQMTYSQNYPADGHSIILRDGIPVGRIWIAEAEHSYRVVDIALLPEYQAHGIGTGLYRDLLERASTSGKSVKCSVSSANPGSFRFHQRLGFRVTNQDGVHASMEWPPIVS